MTKIFFDLTDNKADCVDALLYELRELGEYGAAESAALADVTVTDRTVNAVSGKLIRVFDRGSINADAALDADDLIIYPISSGELHVRIMRLIAPENRIFEKGELKIDFESAEVTVCGERIHLTLIEYRFLALLAKNHGRCVTYKEILASLWECPLGNEMLSVRVFVNAIRRKFAAAGATERYIITHAAKGYELK